MKEFLNTIFIQYNDASMLVVTILVAIIQTGIFVNQYKIANNANKIASYQHKMECYKKIVAVNQQFLDISLNSGSFNQDKYDGSKIEYNGFKGMIKKYTYQDEERPYTVFFPEPQCVNMLLQSPLNISIEAKFLFGDENAKVITNWSNALCKYYLQLIDNSPYNNYKSKVDYRNDIDNIIELYKLIMNDEILRKILDISKY